MNIVIDESITHLRYHLSRSKFHLNRHSIGYSVIMKFLKVKKKQKMSQKTVPF